VIELRQQQAAAVAGADERVDIMSLHGSSLQLWSVPTTARTGCMPKLLQRIHSPHLSSERVLDLCADPSLERGCILAFSSLSVIDDDDNGERECEVHAVTVFDLLSPTAKGGRGLIKLQILLRSEAECSPSIAFQDGRLTLAGGLPHAHALTEEQCWVYTIQAIPAYLGPQSDTRFGIECEIGGCVLSDLMADKSRVSPHRTEPRSHVLMFPFPLMSERRGFESLPWQLDAFPDDLSVAALHCTAGLDRSECPPAAPALRTPVLYCHGRGSQVDKMLLKICARCGGAGYCSAACQCLPEARMEGAQARVYKVIAGFADVGNTRMVRSTSHRDSDRCQRGRAVLPQRKTTHAGPDASRQKEAEGERVRGPICHGPTEIE
jgi:hypothetical protein